MSEQDGISTGRVWIIKINHMYHEIEYINYIFQRQSEDYDDYSDGPTQDPISAQLGLVADSNRCSIFIFFRENIYFQETIHEPLFFVLRIRFECICK